MCNFTVSRATLESRYGIVFADYFRETMDKLEPFVKDCMCRIDANGVAAIGLGQIFVCKMAMCFDAYLGPRQQLGRPVFSRTV